VAQHLLHLCFLQFQANSLKSLAGNMAQDISGGINDAINEHIKPQTDTMLRIVEKMADFTGKIQIEGMEKLLERFGDLVGERLKNQFDNLAETIEEICNWQRSSKDSLDLILTQIQQVTEQQNTMLVNASRAAELFQESLGELGHMHQSLSAATSHFESLLGNLKTHSEWAKDINAEISRTVENFTHLSRENALQTSQQLDHLKDATASSLEQVEVLNTHLSQTVRQQVDHMQEIFNASTQQVQTLNGHLQTSMEKFVSDCREGLGLTFTDFDKHLASLTHALSGTVAETDETVQELLGKMEELRSVTSAMVESQSQFKDTATDVIDHHTLLFGELRELTENLQKVNAQNGGTTLPENAE
jgi:methyl-accepting chemotaxis protein